MPARGVLLRLQNNIRGRRQEAGDLPGALACVEDMLRFAPDTAVLWRDAAVLNQRLDHVAAALRCYERFPGHRATGRRRACVPGRRWTSLRSRLN